VAAHLSALLNGYAKPSMTKLLIGLRQTCRKRGWRCPSRAAVYNFIARAPLPRYRVADLPSHVRDTCFNLGPESDVPGDQVAFNCLNYGGTDAISFAAGLPWRHLYCAVRKRGWRAKSRGLLEAIIRARRA
jgi:hypothetical protein